MYLGRLAKFKDKHENTSTPVQSKKEKRKSLREKTSDNGGPEEDDGTDLLSLSSYQSATSKGMSSVKSCDSVNDAKSMATAVSGSACEDDRMLTPTEDDEERELCSRNCLNKSKEMSEQSLVAMLEERLNEAESSIQDYRDENTVLKCELRDLQVTETTYANSDSKLRERITATEALCDELMEENENLKTEVRDLQQEIEEMQDQYREEEIEEFRELQRELEQNAKNCRILQFKLRKAERIKEQTDAEKLQLQSRINDLIGSSSEVDTESVRSDSIRVKELESELRIAKEVSVRLHTELEQSEEKRYKLEDELFYMKEKVRELQTQNKWRESRNKTDVAMAIGGDLHLINSVLQKRLSTELTTFVPTSDGEVSKELRDALEREIDSREQLKFAEEDLKRTQQRLKEVENENEVLLKKLSKSARLRPPMVRSARIIELEADCATRASINEACPIVGEVGNDQFNLTHEMEKDMGKMIATISDLERKNHELNLHLKNYETKGINSATFTGVSDLRNEKEKRRLLEAEIVELKHTLLKTDNQKVIALATKIEQLNAQHAMINERCTNLHKKAIKNCDNESYMNELKSRLEMLEKENSELKATSIIKEIQGKGTGPEEPLIYISYVSQTVVQMEQCCEVLASIESHTNRLCKQVEKIDQSQKDERRRSLSKDCSAAIIADLANLLAELKSVHKIMDNIKESIPMSVRHSPVLGQESPRETECAKCVENQKLIDEQQNEVIFYKKKNKDLTNQILQTEDRWTIEIEKQRQIFENEIKTLTCRITDYKIQFEEQSQLLQSETFNILEKTRALEEQEEKCKRLQHELEEQKKERQELEQNRKSVREFEIKYKKLESIFDQEREKMNSERTRSKNEVIALKKIAEEAEELLKSTSQDFKKKEALWRSDRDALEKELVSLKKQLLTCKSDEGSDHDDTATVTDSNPENPPSLNRRESDKIHIIDLKKQLALCEKKCTDYETMLEDMKIANADMLDQLNKTKQGWQKDKEAYQHKIRQTEKIRMVEMDALQQKFSSRMRIMEDTNKSLHSQLVLARRERDAHKDMLANFERKVQDEQNENNLREKRISESQEKISYLQKNITELETELERVHTDLRLTKEARRNEKLSENDLRKIEHLQTQFQDCEKFYSKEIERLKKKSKEMVEEFQQEKTVYNKMTTELREQVRVLEIELRNLGQKKDNQAAASEILEAEVTRLQQAIHLNELQKLTRKYRLSSIIDQLQLVTDPIRRGGRSERDGNPGGLKYITSQLIALRDEDAQASVTDEHYSSSQPSLDRNGYTPSMSECEGTYDNISQSSLSIRSVASMPVRGIISTESHGGSDPYARHLTERSNVDPSPVRSIDRKSFKNTKDAGCGTTGQTLTAGCPFQRASSYDRTSDAAVYTSNRYSKNISCHVRHEELTRGGQPSVRLMAQAFEANDNCVMEKQGFFGIRKSRSVETARDCTQKKVEPCDSCNLQYNSNQIKESDESPYATLPRGGRNPFRNMGSKLVERVRRSLSRSSRQSCPDVDESKNDERTSSKVEKSTTSLKKTKKRSAEAKARKNSGNQAMDTKN
ncbi:hypothetical protein DICVIV_05507 [Dictyocaulus viviparus]|uniref:M protein repeat protein n=1 Tax=Dictyocaulus viviparus TaxID=29172 RepID=A0A0D8XX49_DICVI|nr:hypothetical protein DICVIV_05507 [Dictyocaulus viviparus]